MTMTTEPPNRTTSRKLGRRVLRQGDIIKIVGERGRFRLGHFDGDTVTVKSERGARNIRTFTIDRIGVRLALAGTEKAERIWRGF